MTQAGGRSSMNDKVTVLVLIVEDDPMIQTLVEDAIAEGGYQSEVTTSGEEAAERLQAKNAEYRALVTDINLAGKLDGWEVARVAREMNPVLPVIYMTGTHGDDWPARGVPNSILLTKPFAPAQLVTAISQLLNAVPPPTPME